MMLLIGSLDRSKAWLIPLLTGKMNKLNGWFGKHVGAMVISWFHQNDLELSFNPFSDNR